MTNQGYDLEVARFERLLPVLLSHSEAEALERCLELEHGVHPSAPYRVVQLWFAQTNPQAPQVRAVWQEDAPDRVAFQLVRRRGNGVQIDSLVVPRTALGATLR